MLGKSKGRPLVTSFILQDSATLHPEKNSPTVEPGFSNSQWSDNLEYVNSF